MGVVNPKRSVNSSSNAGFKTSGYSKGPLISKRSHTQGINFSKLPVSAPKLSFTPSVVNSVPTKKKSVINAAALKFINCLTLSAPNISVALFIPSLQQHCTCLGCGVALFCG